MPIIKLDFLGNDTISIEAKQGETILQAAKRQGIPLTSDCEIGDCQTCRATMCAGEVVYDEYATVSLTDGDIANGEVLTCVASAKTDAQIKLPYGRDKLLKAKPFRAKVETCTEMGEGVFRLRLQTLGIKPPTFFPGQYINIRVPDTDQWRSYSMANAPLSGRDFELLIRRLPSGAMSDFLSGKAKPGDQLDCQGPYGSFFLKDGTSPIVMVAGGTGLAPMVSMLRQIAEKEPARRVILCFGVNRVEEIFYIEELEALAEKLPGLEIRTAAIEAGRDDVLRGYATDLINANDVLDSDNYLCGPPAMTDAAMKILHGFGVSPDRIFLERFVSSSTLRDNPAKAS